VPDVKGEPFTLLLAVIADVDTQFGLLLHDPVQRRAPQLRQLSRINGFATRPAHIKPG
jgi:hypothetical protein